MSDWQNLWFSIQERENYKMRTLKALAPLGLNVKRDAWHFIRYMFYYYDFRLGCFWAFNFRHDFGFYIHFCFWITQCLLHLKLFIRLAVRIDWLVCTKSIDWLTGHWSKCIVHTLYGFCLFYLYIYLLYAVIAFLSLYY